MKNKYLGYFTNGLIKENPTLRLVLGTCPTLAVTTAAVNGIGMGLSATVVLICSNLAISLLRNIIPDKVRIPAFITIIAGFVSVVQMLVKAFLPAIDKALGIYLPLIVVNCIILARAEMFASKNPPLASVLDGAGMGIGFTAVLTLMGAVRELLGAGSLFLIPRNLTLYKSYDNIFTAARWIFCFRYAGGGFQRHSKKERQKARGAFRVRKLPF